MIQANSQVNDSSKAMKHIHKYLLALLAALMAVLPAFGTPSYRLIPVQTVVVGQNFTVTFRLTNGQSNGPQPPSINGCDLLYGPSVSTMESTTYVNGRMESTTYMDFSYTYRAKTAGTVTIPATSVTAGNQKLTSTSQTLKILPAEQNSNGGSSGGNQRQPRTNADDDSQTSLAPISAKDFFVQVSFSKKTAYEMEPIVATIKVYTKYNITEFMANTQPTFNGFLSEELPVTGNAELENYNGQNYYAAVLKRCLLYPQKTGTLTINAGTYDVTLVQYERVSMGYFVTNRPVERKVTTKTNQASITILPLPEPKPAGFSGAVGKFTASTKIEPELLKTNEAANYTYTIQGTGNIKYLSQPVINFPPTFDTYTPKSDIDVKTTGSNMTGTFKVDYTFVPQQPGKFTIPATPFIYFDLDTKKYVTLDMESYNVNVAKGRGTSVTMQEHNIDTGIEDILYIKLGSKESDQSFTRNYVAGEWWYWLLYAVATGGLITVVAAYRRKLRLRADVRNHRMTKAGKVATKRLKEARAVMNTGNPDQFYAAVSKAIWGFLSDKLGIPASQLTRGNISEELHKKGVTEEETARTIELLDECEAARFSPSGGADRIPEVYSQAVEVIKKLS